VHDYDVIVVGGGNAALCAALSAREHCERVLVPERAPEDESGGNTRFTAGAMRVAYRGIDDLRALMPDLTDDEVARTDFGAYTEDQFLDDIARVTQYRCDPDLTEVRVKRSLDTLQWMRSKGVRFVPIYGRQAFRIDGQFKFWGGLTVEAWGGGPGLVEALTLSVRRVGIDIWCASPAIAMLHGDDGVQGVRVRRDGRTTEVRARSIVLAGGGFQANPEWRARYVGPGWELAKVRGTRFDTGDVIRMALDIGASPAGNWSGCHAVGWERNAPEFGDLAVGDTFQKHSYPFGIMLNADGRRFVDEGADFRNYTYAKYGRVILAQPGQLAWQVFDRKVLHLLRDEYRIRQVMKVTADSLEALVAKLDDVNGAAALDEIQRCNAAVKRDVPFDRELADAVVARGARYLDAPVARTRQAAEEGTLSVMVGGDADTFREVEPIIACFASDITHRDGVGNGQVTKILNNMVLFETVAALSVAAAIARRAGLDPALLFDTLTKGSADSFALRNHGLKAIVPQRFPERSFSVAYAKKDLAYAPELAADFGLDVEGAERVDRLFDRAIEQGMGDRYHPVISKVIDGR
jgi:tricarballylate dehydrogenase